MIKAEMNSFLLSRVVLGEYFQNVDAYYLYNIKLMVI